LGKGVTNECARRKRSQHTAHRVNPILARGLQHGQPIVLICRISKRKESKSEVATLTIPCNTRKRRRYRLLTHSEGTYGHSYRHVTRRGVLCSRGHLPLRWSGRQTGRLLGVSPRNLPALPHGRLHQGSPHLSAPALDHRPDRRPSPAPFVLKNVGPRCKLPRRKLPARALALQTDVRLGARPRGPPPLSLSLSFSLSTCAHTHAPRPPRARVRNRPLLSLPLFLSVFNDLVI